MGSLPNWLTSLAGVGAELRSGARAVGNLAVNGVEAFVDLCQAPQQRTHDTNQRRFPPPPLVVCHMPKHGRVAAINNDVNRAHAKGHLIKNKENMGAREFDEELRAKFRVGDWLEVFSNSCQVWCAAQVSKIPADKTVTVDFRPPGAVEPSHKTLPESSKELRKDVRFSNR